MKRRKPGPIAHNILPTKREVIECLESEITMHKDWYNAPDPLRTIRCLEVALSLVRSKFPRVRRGR